MENSLYLVIQMASRYTALAIKMHNFLATSQVQFIISLKENLRPIDFYTIIRGISNFIPFLRFKDIQR